MKSLADVMRENKAVSGMTLNDITNICDLGQIDRVAFYNTVNELAAAPKKSKVTRLAINMLNWFTEYTNFDLEVKEEIAKSIIEFARCSRKPWFTDIGGKDRLYRGISRPLMDLKKVKFMRVAYPLVIGTATYEAKMPVQSWTTDRGIASRFQTSSPESWMWNIPWVMSVKSRKQDIVFGTTYTKLMSSFTNEHEVVVFLPHPTTVTLMVKFDELMYGLRAWYERKSANNWEVFLDSTIGKQNADLLRGSEDYKSWWKKRNIKQPIEEAIVTGRGGGVRTASAPSIEWTELKKLESVLDSMFRAAGLDIAFTRHFLERINGSRGYGGTVSIPEIQDAFRKTYSKYANQISTHPADWKAIINDVSRDLNMPFVLKWDGRMKQMIMQTAMKKKDFMSPDPKLKV
jgi:hypothetical protein